MAGLFVIGCGVIMLFFAAVIGSLAAYALRQRMHWSHAAMLGWATFLLVAAATACFIIPV